MLKVHVEITLDSHWELVGHGGAVEKVKEGALGLPLEERWEFRQINTAILSV